VLECHTPYPQNLAYLSDVPQGAVSTVIVPSRWQAGEVKRRLRGAIPIDIIPNPLGEGFSEPVTSFPYTRERPIVAWLGRLDDLKNWRGFLEIAGVLAGEGMEFDVWLGARAPSDLEVSEVFHAARRCGLLEQLKWFRNMLHGAMPRFLDAVRDSGGIVVSTARGESFGMTLAEAMARECPVIAPSIGPIPEFIENEVSGILVPPEDIPQAVAACRRLLRDRDLRLAVGRNARASIMRHHEPRQAVARLSTVLWRRAQREAARGSLP
jgi:glycosyltransferase involved in cell wall biosynthesis